MWVVDTTEWASVLCGHHIQNDWRVKQQICIKFCIKFEYSSAETIQMIQKATHMGKWWLAASSQKHDNSCITSRAVFSGKISNHPGESAPPEHRAGALQLPVFPKLKSPFKGKRFQTQWDSRKYSVATDSNWENCVRWGPKVPTLNGTVVSLSCVQYHVSCILYLLQ